MKRYDAAYFQRWYHDPAHRVSTAADLRREVALAVAVAEQALLRPIRSVLDVGAGEGRWQPVVKQLRPGARYTGVEPSEWAVAKWGARRGLVQGDFDALPMLGLPGPFDLVVAADVLHYLPTPAFRRAAIHLAPFVGGIAYLPMFTADDESLGDHDGFIARPAKVVRRLLDEAGFVSLGMHCWSTRALAADLSALERAE